MAKGTIVTVKTVDLEQARRAIVLCMAADIPVALWGGTGIGKTTLVCDLAKDLGWNGNGNEEALEGKDFGCWMINLSVMEPSDIAGIPFPNVTEKGQWAQYMMNKAFPFSLKAKGILFMDEVDRVSREVQNSALRVVDKNVNGVKIGKDVFIIMAGNGTSDIYTTPLSEAYRSRVCHLYINQGSDKAVDGYEAWAEKNGISRLMRSFARFRKEEWTKNDRAEFEELGVSNRRAFDNADRILQMVDGEELKFKTDDILLAVIQGLVGQSAAVQLLAFRDLYKTAPDPREVLKDPDNAPIPEEPAVVYATALAIIGMVEGEKDTKRAKACLQYLVRLEPELGAMGIRKLITEKCPFICTEQLFLNWTEKHKALIE